MEIIFECEDKVGAKLYKEIIKDALRSYAPFFRKIHVFTDIKEPLFIIHASLSRKPMIDLKEMAIVEHHSEGVKIELKEGFKHRTTEVFEILKSVYGEENVNQKEYTIIVKDAKPQDLNLAADFSDKKTVDALVDILMRITPEGFRVTHVLSNHDNLTLISSENPIKNEWIEKAKQIHQLSG